MDGCSSESLNIVPVSVSQNRKATDNLSKYGMQMRFPGHKACLKKKVLMATYDSYSQSSAAFIKHSRSYLTFLLSFY